MDNSQPGFNSRQKEMRVGNPETQKKRPPFPKTGAWHKWPSSEVSIHGRDDGPRRCGLLRIRGLSKLQSVTFKIMNTKIDLKSSVGGLCVGVLTTFAIGAATSPNSVGRYHFGGTGPQYFLVDTSTGQVWTFDTQQAGVPRRGTDPNFFEPKM